MAIGLTPCKMLDRYINQAVFIRGPHGKTFDQLHSHLRKLSVVLFCARVACLVHRYFMSTCLCVVAFPGLVQTHLHILGGISSGELVSSIPRHVTI